MNGPAAILRRYREAYPDLAQYQCFRAGRRLVAARSGIPGTPSRAVSDIRSFIQFRDVVSKQSNFEISRPFFSSMLQDWVIALRCGVRDGKGELIYVIGATLPLSRTQSFWKQAALPQGGALACCAMTLHREQVSAARECVPAGGVRKAEDRNALAHASRRGDFPRRGSWRARAACRG